MAVAAASAVQAGLGVLQTGIGLINSGKEKKEAAILAKTRPKLTVNPNVQSEVSLAQNELSNGMGADATKAYEEGIDKDLSSTLDALLKSGGSPNNIADTFNDSEGGRQKLAMMKDNLRLNNINNLVSAYRNQTAAGNQAFEFNDWMPWADKAQANAQARQQANQQIFGGMNTVGSAAMNFGSTTNSNNQFQDYLKTINKDNYIPTHDSSQIIRDNSIASTNTSNTLQMPPNIDMNLQPSLSVYQPLTPKYNLPQNINF